MEIDLMDHVFGRNVDNHLRSPLELRGPEKPYDHWVDNKVIDHIDELAGMLHQELSYKQWLPKA